MNDHYRLLSITPDTTDTSAWAGELDALGMSGSVSLTAALSATMLHSPVQTSPAGAFLFIRQLAGLKSFLQTTLSDVLVGEGMAGFPEWGIYLCPVYQQSVPFNGFSLATARRYHPTEAAYRPHGASPASGLCDSYLPMWCFPISILLVKAAYIAVSSSPDEHGPQPRGADCLSCRIKENGPTKGPFVSQKAQYPVPSKHLK